MGDRVRAGTRELCYRQSLEFNVRLIHSMIGAKWSIEAEQLQAGLAILHETIERGPCVSLS